MKTAVLLIVFNRPHTTQQVFNQIRLAKPTRLYVSADAPRPGRNEEALCLEARAIAQQVDWDCQVFTQFQEENVGCRSGVMSGISWFLDKEGEGIILEDDTVPNQDFFPFCEELLERYRDDQRVAMIGGCNLNYPTGLNQYSYFFSRYIPTWGWATWKRSWDKFGTYTRHRGEVLADRGMLEALYPDHYERLMKRLSLEQMEQGTISAWDFEFQVDCGMHGMLSVVPTRNLVVNAGFGAHGTHTTDQESHFGNLTLEKMQFPLAHPEYMVRSKDYDDHKFYPNQRIDELMSYREFGRMLWFKTVKKIRGIDNLTKPQ